MFSATLFWREHDLQIYNRAQWVALVNSKIFREKFSALLHAKRIYIVQCIVDVTVEVNASLRHGRFSMHR